VPTTETPPAIYDLGEAKVAMETLMGNRLAAAVLREGIGNVLRSRYTTQHLRLRLTQAIDRP
jgi:hypothetical protein